MQTQRPTRLTTALVLALINGTVSLIEAALTFLSATRGRALGPLEGTTLAIVGILLGLMGIVFVALGIGLWQRRNWARTGSFAAGALGVVIGLGAPIPLFSAIMNLIMILLLRDPEVRAAFEEADMMSPVWTTPTDLMEQAPHTSEQNWQPTSNRDEEVIPMTVREEPMPLQQDPVPFQPEAGPQAQPVAKTEILEKEPGHMAWLIPTTGSSAGTEFRLRDVTTVGRDAQNDITLEDEAISIRHLRVRRRDDQFVLHDLATTNGTIVNGEQVLRHTLTDGDLIKIGNTTLLFIQIITQSDPSKD